MHRNVWVVGGTAAFTVTGIMSWYMLRPVYLVEQLGATVEQAAFSHSLLILAHRLPMVLGGWLADRIGRRRMVIGMTLMMAPCYAGAGLATNWVIFTFFMSATWFFGGLLWPALLSSVAESVPPDRRGRAVSIFETLVTLGDTLGPLIGAYVLDKGFRIPHLIICTALIYVVVGLVRGCFLVETKSVSHAAESSGTPNPWVMGLLLLAAIGGYSAFFLTYDSPYTTLYLRQVYLLTEPQINRFVFLMSAFSIVTALGAGILVDRIGATRAMMWASLLLAIQIVWLTRSPWMAKTDLTFPYGPAYLILMSTILPIEIFLISYMSAITSMTPVRRRGLWVGAYGSLVGLVSGFMPTWVAPLHAAWGLPGPILVAIAGCVVCAFLTMLIVSTRLHHTAKGRGS